MVTAKREVTTQEKPNIANVVSGNPVQTARYFKEYSDDDILPEEVYTGADFQILRNTAKPNHGGIGTIEKRNQASTQYAQAQPTVNEAMDAAMGQTARTQITTVHPPNAAVSSAISVETTKRVKANKKGIFMIVGYVLVVVALIVVIAINAVTISGLSASVANLNQQVEQASDFYHDSNLDLQGVSKPAAPDGMGKPSEIIEVELPRATQKQPPLVHTNAFDAFCNFLSSIFGG